GQDRHRGGESEREPPSLQTGGPYGAHVRQTGTESHHEEGEAQAPTRRRRQHEPDEPIGQIGGGTNEIRIGYGERRIENEIVGEPRRDPIERTRQSGVRVRDQRPFVADREIVVNEATGEKRERYRPARRQACGYEDGRTPATVPPLTMGFHWRSPRGR